jgi:CubicO group peptidase (beta-lactamase class C family)
MESVAPGEVGFSASRLSRVGAWMRDYVEQDKLVGAIAAVARRGKVAYRERFGMMDREAAKPMQFDTIFRIYSMTKPVASVALMMLYEEGRFELTDPVSRFIPGFAPGQGDLADLMVFSAATNRGVIVGDLEREMTIKHLLTHTAGLAYGLSADSPIEALYQEAGIFGSGPLYIMQVPLPDMVQRLVELPLAYQPGDEWRYSLATDVLGYLVEVISDMPLDVFFEEKIFRPLGMEDTAFYVPEEKLERLAALYGPAEGGGVQLLDAPATSAFARPTRCLSGGIGLVSTVSDYVRFAQMLLNGGELEGARLLGRKTVELMTMNHLPDELIPIQVGAHTLHGCGFGLGFRVRVDVARSGMLGSVGEYGWGGYASTSFFVDPRESLVGLLLTQLAPSRYYPIRNEFKVLVYQALVD